MRIFRKKDSDSRRSSVSSTKSERGIFGSRRRSSTDAEAKGRLTKVPASTIQLQHRPSLPSIPSQQELPSRNKLRKRAKDFPVVDISKAYGRNAQTGEQQIDHTDLLHSLVHQESSDTVPQLHRQATLDEARRSSGSHFISRLPDTIWQQIYRWLTYADLASLSVSCQAFRTQLKHYETTLADEAFAEQRTNFLLRLVPKLPRHLLCFKCNKYHRRLHPGKETLRPTNIANPIFQCPYNFNPENRISRTRIKSNRILPFTFVQLVTRHHQHGPEYGISAEALSGRYKDKDTVTEWSHQTRFCMVGGHLLMRVNSATWAPPGLPPAGLRNLLYNSQDEFHPYFSTCPHWRDGELMPLVKCAMSHIPEPIQGGGIDRVGQTIKQHFSPQNPIVTLCSECRPIRRCPECPTEYLIEIKMAEDRSEVDPRRTFKQQLSVTRWSDLGDGRGPDSPEWAACAGHGEGFDSITALGKRAISGTFEAQFNVDLIPGQRILNLNPDKEKKGEAGHRWY